MSVNLTAHVVVVGYVVLARLAELFVAQRNTRNLLSKGGHEAGRRHYPLIVVTHVAWILALAFGVPTDTPPAPLFLALFVLVQGFRYWVIATLGGRWTTRIIVLPGEALVKDGPYRWFKHPNYMVVAAEIALLPLVFGAWGIAIGFSVLNAAVLFHRIGIEERELGL